MNPRKAYRRVSERITLSVAFWLLLITGAATFASYVHTSEVVTKATEEKLDKFIQLQGERESEIFRLAERNQLVLRERLIKNLRAPEFQSVQKYEQIFARSADGAIRDRHGVRDKMRPNFFIPPSLRLSTATKERSVRLYDFLDRECFLSLPSFSDCWVADAEGSLGVFGLDQASYADSMPADFKNMDAVWMKVVSPAEDPRRESRWTKTYLDPNIKVWLITLSTPLYEGDQFIGAIGNDLVIGELVDRVMNFKLDGTKNFLFNSDGSLIAHPDFKDRIREANGLLHVSLIAKEDPVPQESHQFATAKASLLENEGAPHVFDLDSKNLLAIVKLHGPDWYLATVYPKSLIATAAFKASRLVLLFGCLSLFVELVLTMFLINEKLGRPLGQLVSAVKKIGAGDLQTKIHLTTSDEFELLGEAFNEMTYNLGLSRAESQAAIEKAIEANRAKSDFVANISHEMKTPLNGILGMTHFLSESQLNDEQKKYAALIEVAGHHLLDIVNQVLDAAKIEKQKLELEEVDFSLAKLVADVESMTLFSAKQKGLALSFENQLAEPDHLHGDAGRIKQALINLVGNAIKFSETGAVRVKIASSGSKRVRFEVQDDGAGISLALQEKLFQPFSQADSSMSRRHGGTGLGLYLVKMFASLMGGTVGVESKEGVGSKFWFEVPLRAALAAPQLPAAPVAPTAVLSATKPVLVVEDTFVNQVFTEALLKKLGLTSELAKDGREAVEAFAEGKYSLILMDCQMPVMNGYEATVEIRRKETSGARIPIIAVTANSRPKDFEKCMEAGMDDLLIKPVKVSAFKEKIEHWLRVAADAAKRSA